MRRHKNYIDFIRRRNLRKFRRTIERRKIRQHLKSHRTKKIINEQKCRLAPVVARKEIVPCNFDLLNNSEECIIFFNKMRKCLENDSNVHIDMSGVNVIDASSIIFLLSILKNLRHKRVKFRFSGSMPSDETVKNYLSSTGFLNYMNGVHKNFDKSDKTVMIKEGKEITGETAKTICDFVIKTRNKQKKEIKQIYDMLIELMDNTVNHAYDSNEYEHNWYVYCEDRGDRVAIIFFDNGVGIPATVYKTKMEAFQSWLSKELGVNTKSDINVLTAAFAGAFKTRTQEKNRGKGLPLIKKLEQNGDISNLKVITNKASYSKLYSDDNSESLQGTLYYWEVV